MFTPNEYELTQLPRLPDSFFRLPRLPDSFFGLPSPKSPNKILKNITQPTNEQWILLFEAAKSSTSREVCNNNPDIPYHIFLKRLFMYDNGNLVGALKPIKKPKIKSYYTQSDKQSSNYMIENIIEEEDMNGNTKQSTYEEKIDQQSNNIITENEEIDYQLIEEKTILTLQEVKILHSTPPNIIQSQSKYIGIYGEELMQEVNAFHKKRKAGIEAKINDMLNSSSDTISRKTMKLYFDQLNELQGGVDDIAKNLTRS
jgi:hypothetical protein